MPNVQASRTHFLNTSLECIVTMTKRLKTFENDFISLFSSYDEAPKSRRDIHGVETAKVMNN